MPEVVIDRKLGETRGAHVRLNDPPERRIEDLRDLVHDLLYAKSKCRCGSMAEVIIDDQLPGQLGFSL